MLIVSGSDIEKALLKLKKSAEKAIIKTWVASQAYSTSENRKNMMKSIKKNGVQELKSFTSSYVDSFSSSAKGQWVTQAKNSIKETTKVFNNF